MPALQYNYQIMLKILQSPHKVLSQEAKPVAKIDKTIHQLLKEMEETLDGATDPEGVGLAAPQIGRSLQIFIVRQTPKSEEGGLTSMLRAKQVVPRLRRYEQLA